MTIISRSAEYSHFCFLRQFLRNTQATTPPARTARRGFALLIRFIQNKVQEFFGDGLRRFFVSGFAADFP